MLRSGLFLFLFGLVSGIMLVAQSDVHSVVVQGDGVNTRIIISADSEISHAEFLTSGSGSSLVVDVDHKPWVGEDKDFEPASGVLAHEWVDGQLVFWLEAPMLIARTLDLPPYGSRPSHRLIIDLAAASQARFDSIARKDMKRLAALASERRLASAEGPKRVAAGGQRHVIVIDPGHGGRDPGASYHGAVERTIVLDSAKRLKTMLEANPRYDVRLTRSDDRFIEVQDRISLAREWGADLFISIHADAAAKPSVKGASVYTLSAKGERRVDETVRNRNWVLPIETGDTSDEVSDILEDFLKRETKSSSEKFASLLISELGKSGPLLRNSMREGNFFVLLAPDVPAVLLEMGFLSNRDDARRLSSSTGQRRSMRAVADAIDTYFQQQDLLLAQN